jgi:hypothetical protein
MLIPRLSRSLALPLAGPSLGLRRGFHVAPIRLDLDRSAASASSSTPQGEDIPARLIGTREEIERKKVLARDKYKAQLEKRMKE